MKAVRTIISLWKVTGLSICLVIVVSYSSIAQCAYSLQTITYDTVVIGSGNDNRAFTFSQFDPSIGTLTGVNVSSVVSVNYGFTLKNINSSPINFSIAVGRNDDFQSTVLISPYSNSMMADVGTFLLNPNQIITQPLANVINRYDNSVDINTNVVDFIGNGTIGFNYTPHTYTSHSGSTSYQYSASASDTIHFSISYTYCNGIVLSNDITNFSAAKENSETAKLLWTTVNEQPGRIYEVEKSVDGKNFFTAGDVSSVNDNSTSNYIYHYQITATEKTNLWFRLKIKDASGAVKYSAIRIVDMSSDFASGIYLYPNPSDQFINIVFNQAGIKNWQVDIFAANGMLVQKSIFKNAGSAHIDFQHRLPRGVYFAKATDQQTLKNYVLSFVVR